MEKKIEAYFCPCLQYDATVSGGYGGGGEYEVQLGFGWSNGLILDLLDKYGDRLTADNHFVPSETTTPNTAAQIIGVSTAGQVMTGVLALIISLAAGFIG
jgi:alpha,alpha-trehalase